MYSCHDRRGNCTTFRFKSSFNVYSTNDGFAKESHSSKNFPCLFSDCDGSGYRRKNSATLQRTETVLPYLLFMKFFRHRPLLETVSGYYTRKGQFLQPSTPHVLCLQPVTTCSVEWQKSSVSLHWHFLLVFCCHASRSFHLILSSVIFNLSVWKFFVSRFVAVKSWEHIFNGLVICCPFHTTCVWITGKENVLQQNSYPSKPLAELPQSGLSVRIMCRILQTFCFPIHFYLLNCKIQSSFCLTQSLKHCSSSSELLPSSKQTRTGDFLLFSSRVVLWLSMVRQEVRHRFFPEPF